MKITIRYQAAYQYEDKASLSPHTVRLFPRNDPAVQITRRSFKTHFSADVKNRQDLFDNLIASCFYPYPIDLLEYQLELDINLRPKNAFHFLVDSHALNTPFAYRPEESLVLSPYLQRQTELPSLPEALTPPTKPRDTIEALIKMNNWIFQNFEYERRDEGEAYNPQETLQLAKGSCRDFAVLLAEVLRHWGIAVRLVSGFLWESVEPGGPSTAENALHAWLEAYVPGAGWIGMDPTNGVFCDHHFIATAVGLTPAQIAPVYGSYYGDRPIASTLTTKLVIKEEQS